ncbi:MAG TPA: alpha/beta fold hydrolase [Nocardioides sp.]|nr:alpha/beta fold hydrolase [Nocardioides sp.]
MPHDLPAPQPGARPGFTDLIAPEQSRATVLVLHGGAEHNTLPLTARSLSWRRARRLALDLARPLNRDDIAVAVLRYRVIGWNAGRDDEPSPVPDARWALEELQRTLGTPVVILGHSMGARTAAAVADHPSVRGVVGLAPWLPADDPVDRLRDKTLLTAHGARDKITSPKATRRYVARAAEVGTARFTDMGPVGHYLLRDVRSWNRFALQACREIAQA